MKILKTHWYSPGIACIGIVRVMHPLGEIKHYIGQGSGLNEEADAKFVAEHGSPFPEAAANAIFGVHPPKNAELVPAEVFEKKEQQSLLLFIKDYKKRHSKNPAVFLDEMTMVEWNSLYQAHKMKGQS